MVEVMTLAILFALAALQISSPPKLGGPAPPMSLELVLQAPSGTRATWSELQGSAMVLEFWATWCASCVEQIPHLNALAEKFKSQPIKFIAVTDEEEGVVTRFLAKHPMAGWVALDSRNRTFREYAVEGRPRTFLIDSTGVIRAVTVPQLVTDAAVEDLLAGRGLHLSQPESILGSRFIGSESGAPTPLIDVLIRPAAPVALTGMSPGATRKTEGRFEVWGVTLRELLSQAYGTPSDRIELPEWGSETRYDLSVLTPWNSGSQHEPLVREAIVAAFGLKLRHERRRANVYLLKTIPGHVPKLKRATERGQSAPWSRQKGELQAIGMSAGYVASIAGTVLGRPTFDETGIKGRYDFDLTWDSKNPESIITAVRDQLGLELKRTQRPLEYLVVESAREPKTR